jgi:hypothetical protein
MNPNPQRRLLALGAMVCAWHPLSAQLTIQCSGALDNKCRATVAAADSLQHAEMVLTVLDDGRAVPGTWVRLYATSGLVQPDSARTDRNGSVAVVWLRSKGAEPVGIVAQARTATASGLASIRLTPATNDPSKASIIALHESMGFRQSWFEKGQLPSAVEVELMDSTADQPAKKILDPARCAANRVVFKARGAPSSVSPDTALPSVYKPDGCFAWTFWSLGEGVGVRTLDVSLAPGQGYRATERLEAVAWARATPRFVAGFGPSRLRQYTTLNDASKRTVRVERIDQSGVKRSYDTTETTGKPAVSEVGAKTEYGVIAGVSLPIPLAFLDDWDVFSLTGGVDLAHPTDRVFAGISAMRLLGRAIPVIETLPFDLHVVGLWARQLEIENPGCAADQCKTHKPMRFQHFNWMVTADMTSLVSELVKKLAP